MPYLRKISRENSDGKKLLCGYDNGGRTGPNHFDFSRFMYSNSRFPLSLVGPS